VTVDAPLFMEMELGGLVAAPPGPVVGVIGYDLLRRFSLATRNSIEYK